MIVSFKVLREAKVIEFINDWQKQIFGRPLKKKILLTKKTVPTAVKFEGRGA